MDVLRSVVPLCAILAISGGCVGAVTARIFWAQDLTDARNLKVMWDKTYTALNSTIASQERTIAIQNETIMRLQFQRQLTTQDN